MAIPKIVKKDGYLRVQFEDGKMLPETELIIKSSVGSENLVEVTITFHADIKDL